MVNGRNVTEMNKPQYVPSLKIMNTTKHCENHYTPQSTVPREHRRRKRHFGISNKEEMYSKYIEENVILLTYRNIRK